MTTFKRFYGDGGAPIDIAGPPDDVLAPWISHRERFRAFLAGLDDEQWQARTRCTEWDVLDLVHHLTSVTQFFGATIHKACKGEQTRFLETFDPKTTPTLIVRAMSDGPAESLAAFDDVDRAFAAQVRALTADQWLMLAEAPPGHLPVRLTLNHALFDSWIHERDVMVPMGTEPPADPAEVESVGRYVAALAGGAASGLISDKEGTVPRAVIRVTDPDGVFGVDTTGSRVTVTAGEAPEGAPSITGRAADVLDLLTGREPMKPVEADPGARPLLDGFASILR